MNRLKNMNIVKLVAYSGVSVVILVIILRFALFYFRSDRLSGMSILLPSLAGGIIIFALLMSSLFAAWVYKDCRMREDDGILWAAIVFITTPFIGLLVYFLRRSEVKRNCSACGHLISLKAKFCEECGTKNKNTEEIIDMELKRTHHIKIIVMGIICMVLMLTCLTGFVVSATSGKAINEDVTSNEKVWNMGSISMNYNTYIKGVWELDFKGASDGFVIEKNMNIIDSKNNYLYADIFCKTIPDGSSLTLHLVQGDVAKSVDVTNLSEPLEYSLADFENGKIHVRLQINGVKDVVSEINIK